MATIKSYTDISQSKKLAEILPLESADMHYWRKGQILGVGHSKEMQEGFESKGIDYTPCWSLAALLDVIPYNVTFNKAVYRFKLIKFLDHWECYHENFGSVSTKIFKADNPVDACVAMIENLHELNLL